MSATSNLGHVHTESIFLSPLLPFPHSKNVLGAYSNSQVPFTNLMLSNHALTISGWSVYKYLTLFLRLHHAHKLGWMSAWLSVALHLTKVSTGLRAILPTPPSENILSSALYEEITTFLLAVVFLKGFLFENHIISFKRVRFLTPKSMAYARVAHCCRMETFIKL